MNKFYSLIQWLYPSICQQLNIQSNQLSFDNFLEVNRLLLRSGMDEGFLIAIKCINDDIVRYTIAAKESELIDLSSQMFKKQAIFNYLALSDQDIISLPGKFSLLNTNDKVMIRAKLNKMIDICLPLIFWSAFCDLNEYKELCSLQLHKQIAELLFSYALTFLPDQQSIIASSGLPCFIQLINPSQSVQDIQYKTPLTISYLKTIEARKNFSNPTGHMNSLKGAIQ